MKQVLLRLVQLFHLLNEIFISTYIFWFRTPKYDLYFSIYLFLISIHWYLFKNECVISYMEKKIMDSSYKMGQEPYYHPFQSLLPKFVSRIFAILKLINILWVIYRNYKINNTVTIIMAFILIINIYINYKKYIVDKHKF